MTVWSLAWDSASSVMAKIVESKPGSWTFLFADIGFALLVATRFAGVL
jgi:hypothetical protein